MTALGIIIENELMFLERHYDYIVKFFDKVFVADNGSTDGSIQFLTERKAHIIQGDFGHGKDWKEMDHKNAPIVEAEKEGFDWYVSLDVDEVLTSYGVSELKRFMDDSNEVLVLPRIEFFGDVNHYTQKPYPDYQARAIRLNKGYHWRNTIHSSIYQNNNSKSCWELNNYTIVPTAQIYHYGWALALERRQMRYYGNTYTNPDFLGTLQVWKGEQPV